MPAGQPDKPKRPQRSGNMRSHDAYTATSQAACMRWPFAITMPCTRNQRSETCIWDCMSLLMNTPAAQRFRPATGLNTNIGSTLNHKRCNSINPKQACSTSSALLWVTCPLEFSAMPLPAAAQASRIRLVFKGITTAVQWRECVLRPLGVLAQRHPVPSTSHTASANHRRGRGSGSFSGKSGADTGPALTAQFCSIKPRGPTICVGGYLHVCGNKGMSDLHACMRTQAPSVSARFYAVSAT